MSSVCFYFQVHQPYRLRTYSFFDIGNQHDYLDEKKNEEIMHKVADKCYLRTNLLMLELIRKHQGKFRIAYSISGMALEQFEQYRPDVLASFIELAETGCVEFLAETHAHSLSFIYSRKEFKRQVNKHAALIKRYFNQTPRVFRNTELIFNNDLANYLESMGYDGVLSEGVDRHLDARSPDFVYQAPGASKIKCLLKNYRLSDDIAFRFSDKGWSHYPLTADTFKDWIHARAGSGEVVNLFMDYETFGEHQWEDSGIFEFLKHLPEAVLSHPDFSFNTPTEVLKLYPSRGVYDVHEFTSWADTERDLSAWLSNPMQQEASRRIYSMESQVHQTGDPEILKIWERMLTSDHFYYMCTKFWNDGDVHKYFSPYDSPYDAYMYFMNVYSDFEQTVKLLNTFKQREEQAASLQAESWIADRKRVFPNYARAISTSTAALVS